MLRSGGLWPAFRLRRDFRNAITPTAHNMGTNRISEMGAIADISSLFICPTKGSLPRAALPTRWIRSWPSARISQSDRQPWHGSCNWPGQEGPGLVRGAVAAQVGTDPSHSRPAPAQSAPRVPWSAESRAAQHRLARTRRDIGDLYVVDGNSTVSNRSNIVVSSPAIPLQCLERQSDALATADAQRHHAFR